MSLRLVSLIALGTSLTLAGCAAKGTPRDASTSDRDPDRITATEIAATPVSNAHDLVNRLRPRWLQAGAGRTASISDGRQGTITQPQVVVYLDDTYLGGIGALRSLTINGFKSVRFYDAARAATVLRNPPQGAIGGAIVISTRE